MTNGEPPMGVIYAELPKIGFLATETPMSVPSAFAAQTPQRRLASATEVAIKLAHEAAYPDGQDVHLTSTCSMYWQAGGQTYVAFDDSEENPLEVALSENADSFPGSVGFCDVPHKQVERRLIEATKSNRIVALDIHPPGMTNLTGRPAGWNTDPASSFIQAVFGDGMFSTVFYATRNSVESTTAAGEEQGSPYSAGAWKITYLDSQVVRDNVPEGTVRLGSVGLVGKTSLNGSDYTRMMLLSYPIAIIGNAHFVEKPSLF